MRTPIAILLACAALAACDKQWGRTEGNQTEIRVVSDEQKQLHQLDAYNLAIGLKRAIYDSGYHCQRITRSGYVGDYKNLEMWMASCADGHDWAIFTGPDGSAQVRDCKDVVGSGLPACVVKQRPKGSFGQIDPPQSVLN